MKKNKLPANLPRVLLTGFDPFGGEAVNPSQLIAEALDGEIIADHRIVGALLPTEFAASGDVLSALLHRHRPALVIAVGQAGGRSNISLERVAINLVDARIPDNAGAQPVDVHIVENASNAYFSTLPIKAMLQRLREAAIPTEISNTAGMFVCNAVFFDLMHRLRRMRRPVRGGFIHVPYAPSQVAEHSDVPSLPLATMIDALRLSIETALTTQEDLHYAAGTTH